MSRFQFDKNQQKGLHPIWRGIGFVIFMLLTVGGFMLVGYLLDLNAQLGTTLLLVTHDETLAARCGRAVRLVAGGIAP